MDDNFKNDTSIKPDTFVDKLVTKQRDVLIQFKTMQEILNKENSWFDGYGNLWVQTVHGPDHLTPNQFSNLGKQKTMKSHHGYPGWCIVHQWEDLFAANMALRYIATGKMDKEDAVELAKKAILVP